MSPTRFSHAWPAIPASVPDARHAVVDYVRDASGPDAPLGDIALAVSEGVTNAVHHAYLEGGPGEFRVDVELAEDALEVVIEDDGRGMVPRADSPGSGLGFPLMATVARFDASTPDAGGTRVSLRFPRQAQAA